MHHVTEWSPPSDAHCVHMLLIECGAQTEHSCPQDKHRAEEWLTSTKPSVDEIFRSFRRRKQSSKKSEANGKSLSFQTTNFLPMERWQAGQMWILFFKLDIQHGIKQHPKTRLESRSADRSSLIPSVLPKERHENAEKVDDPAVLLFDERRDWMSTESKRWEHRDLIIPSETNQRGHVTEIGWSPNSIDTAASAGWSDIEELFPNFRTKNVDRDRSIRQPFGWWSFSSLARISSWYVGGWLVSTYPVIKLRNEIKQDEKLAFSMRTSMTRSFRQTISTLIGIWILFKFDD